MRIVIPGGSGHLGQVLARSFHEKGHVVTVIGRTVRSEPWRTAIWNGLDRGAWTDELDGADVVINLAGRSVNCRYTQANRQEILESRVEATRAVGEAIARASRPPVLWINMSTATIYRHALDRAMDEASGEIGGTEPGLPDTWRFSIGVATSWERAFFESVAPCTRKIALRTAIVMSPERGGPFQILSNLVRWGLGGKAGGGTQFVSWIHEADFIRSIEWLIERKDIEGVVNVSAPHPLPNRDFMKALRQAWNVPFGLPATGWMLEIGAWALRSETELILKSRRVVPGRLLDAGFGFQFPMWLEAARDLVSRSRPKQ